MNNTRKITLLLLLFVPFFGLKSRAANFSFDQLGGITDSKRQSYSLRETMNVLPSGTNTRGGVGQPGLRAGNWWDDQEEDDNNNSNTGENVLGTPIVDAFPVLIALTIAYGIAVRKQMLNQEKRNNEASSRSVGL